MANVCVQTALAALLATGVFATAFVTPAFADELVVVERAASDTVIDLGDKGDSLGDLLTFANDVYDKDNVALVGHDNGWCVRTVVAKAWECHWTLTLEKGQIAVDGPFYDTSDSVLSITGGTGAFVKARGEMKLHARNAKGSEYDFVYVLMD
jgi:allene oxide cyclase